MFANFIALDGDRRRGVLFEIDQYVDVMLFAETVDGFGFVLVNASDEIVRYSGIKASVFCWQVCKRTRSSFLDFWVKPGNHELEGALGSSVPDVLQKPFGGDFVANAGCLGELIGAAGDGVELVALQIAAF